MEDFIVSQNYDLTEKEENDSIEKINKLLKDYEKLLKLDSDYVNMSKIYDASKISELMLNLLLKKEGYFFKSYAPFNSIINFSINQKIIPQECIMFLQIIKEYRTKSVHKEFQTTELTQTFLNAFMCYISWFDDNYSSKYKINNPFKIEECCAEIISLEISNKNKKTLKIESKGVPKGSLPTVKERSKKEVYDKPKITVCPECGSEELIGDYERAEVVCARCGLVIDNLVDMGPEWRAFDHEQRDKRTPIEAPITHTIHDKGLSTMIDWRNKDIYGRDIPARNRAQWYRLRKWQRKIRTSGATERNLAYALSEIDRNSSRLGLPRSVREAASVIYRSAMDNKLVMGRSIESLVAASLYAACRRCNVPRTLKEIAEVSHLTKKEVGRTYRFLTRELNLKLPPNSPVDYVPRFASELGLSEEAESKAIEIIDKSMEKGLASGKDPIGVAAAALYFASISLDKIDIKEVADITGVTEVTIRKRYKELNKLIDESISKSVTQIEEIERERKLKLKEDIKFSQKFMAAKLSSPSEIQQNEMEKVNLISKSDSPLNKDNQDKILEELQRQNETLKQILATVLETNEIAKSINEKISQLTKTLDGIQSHTEKLINNAFTEDEINRIIQVHTTECIENILEYSPDINQDEQYKQEEIKLIDIFEEGAWNKLSKDSQDFLIISKFMYNKLITSDKVIDYSAICILVTKALEVEIFNRFFTNFITYLDETYNKDYSKYPTTLLFQNKTPLYPERFTMGNIAFVLCYKEDYLDNDEQKMNNRSKLMEYCKKYVFSRYSTEEITRTLNEYAKEIERIRIDYRNPSAHRGQIGRKNAKECFNLVIDVEKLLKRMLDSFDN